MDVVTFVTELLSGLSALELVQGVTSHAEGPTVRVRILEKAYSWLFISTR
jgi:hypothetical protein